jgi:hypothetical protein
MEAHCTVNCCAQWLLSKHVYAVPTPLPCCCRRYFTCALKHAQELAEQVKITAATSRAGCVEMQEQVR